MLKLSMEMISECVLNFSEGRRREIIDAVANAAAEVDGVFVLQIDSHKDANRTVLTFAGDPESVCEAAFRAVKTVAERIDMRLHSGTHARIGAADVVPIVPVKGLSLADAVSRARALGERIGGELRLPVYLYAEAARSEQRRRLPFIRRGEYEGLAARMVDGFLPDYGPTVFNPRFGACAVGARRFMIAYNVNIPGNESILPILNRIAARLRSSGDGKKAGRLKEVQAKPWFSSDFGMCQMTANLFDFRQTGVEGFFEAVKAECMREGLSVDGSELIGLIPAEALLQAADFYGFPNSGKNEADACAFAGERLGLNRCKPFNVQERVFEFALEKAKKQSE